MSFKFSAPPCRLFDAPASLALGLILRPLSRPYLPSGTILRSCPRALCLSLCHPLICKTVPRRRTRENL